MLLRGIISSKYTDILLGHISGVGLKFKESTRKKQLEVRKTGNHRWSGAISEQLRHFLSGDSCGYFCYICCKQKELDPPGPEDFVLLSLHTI